MSRPVIRHHTTQSPEVETVLAIISAMETAVVALELDRSDPNTGMLIATACTQLAGSMFGQAVIMGLMTDRDQRRFTDAMVKNMLAGITVAKAAAEPVGRQRYPWGMPQ